MADKPSTRRDVLQLSYANVFSAVLLFIAPLVLVRVLDQTEYGEYRLLWVVGSTVTALLPLSVDRSLLYFLPRSEPQERLAYISQTLLYFGVSSMLAGLVLSQGELWLPESFDTLKGFPLALAAFGALWLFSSLVRVLPNAEHQIAWQSRAIAGLALARLVLIVGAALLTSDIVAVLGAAVAFVFLQTLLFAYYLGRQYRFQFPVPRWDGMKRQLGYAFPFGLSSGLGQALVQVELWIVAVLFAPTSLALFSVGTSFNAIIVVLRRSLVNVLLPRMSAAQVSGDVRRALQLNSRGNLGISLIIFPIVSFIWVFADPLITLLYTDDYVGAVAILRIYSIVLILMSVELGTVLWVLEQGKFVAKVSACVLLGSSILSIAGANLIGLAGVAVGSMVGTFANRLVNFRHAARLLGITLGELQDWNALGRLLLAAAGSGCASYFAQQLLPVDLPTIWKLLTGACMLSLSYLLLLLVLRVWWVAASVLGRRNWMAS